MTYHPFNLPGITRYILLGVVLLIILIFRGSQLFSSRGRTRLQTPLGEPRNYGITGGAICPRCHRPFPLNLMAFRLGFGVKYTPCPYCGKWSLVHRASVQDLRAAEAAELGGVQPAQPASPEDEAAKLKGMVDDTRFTDKE